jgi:hypothetical protein
MSRIISVGSLVTSFASMGLSSCKLIVSCNRGICFVLELTESMPRDLCALVPSLASQLLNFT